MGFINKVVHFVTTEIWSISYKGLSRPFTFFLNGLKITILSFRGFQQDSCTLRASALTYYTLLAIVPILAMLFGVAKGFGFEALLEEQILSDLQSQETIILKSITFAKNMLENTKGGLIAGIGVVTLFWTIIKVLTHIEDAFNTIWGIRHGRSWQRRCSDYLSVSIICPFLLIIGNATTVLVSSKIYVITEQLSFIEEHNFFILLLIKCIPYFSIWTLLTFLYLFMPNTKVGIGTALLSGVVTGTLYLIFHWIYINFQVGIATYGAIYGSFAALPLFLLWLQTSWLIVLLGAEVAFSFQNIENYEHQELFDNISLRSKKLVAIMIMHFLVKVLLKGEKPLSTKHISRLCHIPVKPLRNILRMLLESGLIAEVNIQGEEGYQLSHDPHTLSIHSVGHAMEHLGGDPLPCEVLEKGKTIDSALNKIEKVLAACPSNALLKDLKIEGRHG